MSEHGYSLNSISWMAAPVDFVPVKFHEYGICAADGEEIHAERDARLKDFSIYDSVQEVKHREQQELVEKLHRYGKHEEDYFELIGRDNERKILHATRASYPLGLRLSFYSQRGNTLFPTWEHFIPNVGIIVTLNGDSESA